MRGEYFMEYVLVTAAGALPEMSGFNVEVNKKLNEGFELYGSPGLTFDPKTGTKVYFQALVKK
jgi:hypothetical protein